MTGSPPSVKELILFVARSLVDRPDAVEVREIESDEACVLELKVPREDLGKVIGKQGRTARAMRTLLGVASTKLRKRVILEIVE